MISCFAPAKINLSLHITGKRADGYHLLDSWVVFADIGDHVTMDHGDLALAITGPERADLTVNPDNLVLRAAHFAGLSAQITLNKHLPIASGIGGGSSDAAAALRGLAHLHKQDLPGGTEALGADLPMCLAATPLRAQGIGEQITPLPALPPLWVVLVNPRVSVPTGQIFACLERVDNPPLPDDMTGDIVTALRHARNDLQSPALAACPAINDILAALTTYDPMLCRMSGSGATCFGLFTRADLAEKAAAGIRRARPDWWVRAGSILGPHPQLIRATT